MPTEPAPLVVTIKPDAELTEQLESATSTFRRMTWLNCGILIAHVIVLWLGRK